MKPFLDESDDEVVELDTWSEEEDGVEDPFDAEDELPADEEPEEARFADAFEAQAAPAARPAEGASSGSPARTAAALKILRLLS